MEFEGKYYFISDYNKYARNITLNLDDTFVKGTGLTPGNYYFDADGVMSVKNGPDADGYFYLDGKKITGYQIISYEGDYYFISDGNKYAKSIRPSRNHPDMEGCGRNGRSYRKRAFASDADRSAKDRKSVV